MNIKALIPNFFTMLNLFCGCVALVFVSNTEFELAFFFVSLGIFFDFFDGFFARKFNVAGPLGVQLDSLADMVTSGVVPGYVMYKMLLNSRLTSILEWLPFLGFIITLGACYRLAKFNIDTRQSDSFIGLPTPANALFFTSLPILPLVFHDNFHIIFSYNKWILLALTFLSAYVMNAEIPLFSLKIKNFSFAKYKLQIFFLAISVLMLIFLQIVAVPLIILLYVLLSVINNIVNKKASV
ncbi:CDP-diacylglycerol--serine O-phosphatidyltransferase [Flavobacterium macrobrachii]|uniref:CDP-diacylglycerol--serine O-phosphatidyltransferase n=1 Tax=Flavobacterium macrobrachii TaxID=591204 RepID=A0ABS2CW92_9FLAO|nr:CDP-diacylglycerol--serine O-phosphatidyltransferase [Flavobacterium macrobrachii]MBM6499234.1 CDP-diacylglycerol--serine O-phosphatidyltransferase [Flavobacterium macrobrachii]